METSFGSVGRGRAFHGAHTGRVERIGHRCPVPQNTRQRQYTDPGRPWQPIPSERQTAGGKTVRRHRRHW